MIQTLLIALGILAILFGSRIVVAAQRYERGVGDVVHFDFLWVVGPVALAFVAAAVLVSKKVI